MIGDLVIYFMVPESVDNSNFMTPGSLTIEN
jgi:hypothetical protein